MHLKINEEKTKVMLFGMNEDMEKLKFAIGDAEIEKVNECGYLGRTFTSYGRITLRYIFYIRLDQLKPIPGSKKIIYK